MSPISVLGLNAMVDRSDQSEMLLATTINVGRGLRGYQGVENKSTFSNNTYYYAFSSAIVYL